MDSMKDHHDFSGGKRGAVIPTNGKARITIQKTTRKKYKLADLLAKCDPNAPIPTAVTE